jgi:hypothetical protein
MTKRQKTIVLGACFVVGAIVILSLAQCRGLCRSIAGQVESIGIADILTGLFG